MGKATMKKAISYLGVVDRAEDGTWGVVFPDLPGCTSAGADMDDLREGSIEALRLWAEVILDAGGRVPAPRSPAALMADPEVREMVEAAAPFGCLLEVPLISGRAPPHR